MSFMIPLGYRCAAATRVGNALGAGDATGAHLSAWTALRLALVAVLCTSVLILCVRSVWGRVFTSDADVIDAVAVVCVVAAVYVIPDGAQTALTGVVEGAGRQSVAAPVAVVSYYVIGLPLSALFAFVFHWGVVGLCLGVMLGTCVHAALMVCVVWRMNWGEEVSRARCRVGDDDGDVAVSDGVADVGVELIENVCVDGAVADGENGSGVVGVKGDGYMRAAACDDDDDDDADSVPSGDQQQQQQHRDRGDIVYASIADDIAFV